MMDNKEIESLMKIMAFDASKSYVTWKEVKLRIAGVFETHRNPQNGDLHKKNRSFKHIFRADRILEHDIEASKKQGHERGRKGESKTYHMWQNPHTRKILLYIFFANPHMLCNKNGSIKIHVLFSFLRRNMGASSKSAKNIENCNLGYGGILYLTIYYLLFFWEGGGTAMNGATNG